MLCPLGTHSLHKWLGCNEWCSTKSLGSDSKDGSSPPSSMEDKRRKESRKIGIFFTKLSLKTAISNLGGTSSLEAAVSCALCYRAIQLKRSSF